MTEQEFWQQVYRGVMQIAAAIARRHLAPRAPAVVSALNSAVDAALQDVRFAGPSKSGGASSRGNSPK